MPGYFPGFEFSRMNTVYVGFYERCEFSRLASVRGYRYLLKLYSVIVITENWPTGTGYQRDGETRRIWTILDLYELLITGTRTMWTSNAEKPQAQRLDQFGSATNETWPIWNIKHRDSTYLELSTDTEIRPIWTCYQRHPTSFHLLPGRPDLFGPATRYTGPINLGAQKVL